MSDNNTSPQVYSEIDKAPGITMMEQELIISYKKDPKYKDMAHNGVVGHDEEGKEITSMDVLTKAITNLVLTIYVESGDKFTAESEQQTIIERNMRDISRHFSYYSLKDIERCYEMGVRGELETQLQKFQGECRLSVDILFSWLKEFRTHRGRAIIKQQQYEINKQEQQLLASPDEKLRRHREFTEIIAKEYNHFLHDDAPYPVQFALDAGNKVYDYLKQSRHVKLKAATKEKMLKQARKVLTAKYGAIDINPDNVINQAIDRIQFRTSIDKKEKAEWLIKLPARWQDWRKYKNIKAVDELFEELLAEAKRLTLRVIIYGWKKEKRKMEEVIKEIEKNSSTVQ